MTWWAIVSTELLKLKRSRVLAVAVVAPILLVAGVQLMMWGYRQRGAPAALPYMLYVQFATQLWAFFLLPLSVTLISVLSAQIEHGARAWNYVLATPVPRWRLYTVKAGIVLTLAAVMSVAVVLLLPLGGIIRELSEPGMAGRYMWKGTAETVRDIYAGAVLMIAIQLWFALRVRNLVISMGVGVAGGFLAVVSVIVSTIMRDSPASVLRYFPWVIPLGTTSNRPELENVMWVGLIGGLLALVAMIADLSRREVP